MRSYLDHVVTAGGGGGAAGVTLDQSLEIHPQHILGVTSFLSSRGRCCGTGNQAASLIQPGCGYRRRGGGYKGAAPGGTDRRSMSNGDRTHSGQDCP